MSPHRQLAVKVNALVDEGVAPLVEALSATVGVVTLDSCEGDEDLEPAHVYFCYGSGWSDVGRLADLIAERLREDSVEDYSVSVEWFGSNEQPRARLSVPKACVAAAATALRQLRP